MEKSEIKYIIRAKVAEIARELGNDASQLADDDIIPATGLVDSAGILGLVVWYEKAFDIPLKQEEINIDNLGSIESMADYVLKRESGLIKRRSVKNTDS